MSADLLAEFDSFYQAPQTTKPNPTPSSNDLSFLSDPKSDTQAHQAPNTQWGTVQPVADVWGAFGDASPSARVQQTTVLQDDGWGSFEAFSPQATHQSPPTTQPGHNGFISSTRNDIKPNVVRKSTLNMFVSDFGSVSRSSSAVKDTPPSKPVPMRQSSSGGDILFDADDVSETADDDDDFGDFETVAEPVSAKQPPPSQSLDDLFQNASIERKTSKRPPDLLSTTMTSSSVLPYPQAPRSPSFQERNPFSDLGLATKQISLVKKEENPKSASFVTAWPNFTSPKPASYVDSPHDQIDDDWGDFADLPPETPAPASEKPTSGIEADAWVWDAVDKVAETASPVATAPPPSNVPPPSVLLSLFSSLFDLPQSTLFKAVANQPFSLKTRIISDPSTVDFLRAYLLIATVAAYILAGRKVRWKRDTLLSQAMKIGPAAAGGKGGMKLTGVDKSEVGKEDREATDVLRLWREQLGRLRSAVAVANQSIKEASMHLSIPEINEAMHVKVQEGALTAPKPCVICGLKRDERVSKVDVQVEDSFGEWWIEYWGHRACRNFWQEHESKLKYH